MKVAEARAAARRWVEEVASELPGYRGAFFHGSIHAMSDDDDFPPTSDVDVGVVFAEGATLPRLGKVLRGDLVVEGAPIASSRLATAEQLLGDYRLAPSFWRDGVISDPTGHLAHLQREVAARFAERTWVLARCEDARRNGLRFVAGVLEGSPYPTRAMSWLFAEGSLAHVLLASGLRNPTVRRRYSAVRELLAEAARLDVHESLLRMLGCQAMSRARVVEHLDRMTEAFDRAASAARSELPFAPDIAPSARGLTVGGSRALVERGEHREAVFWIAVTHARCLAVLETDGSHPVPEETRTGFRHLLRDLGVETFAGMRRRTREIEAFLPDLMAVARELAAANPGIRG